MMNVQLADLNFRSLIDYGGQPTPNAIYPQPMACRGYCTSCEDQHIVQAGYLDQMSHGCDTSDFEAWLGDPLPIASQFNSPVLFLLEDLGGYYSNGARVEFRGLSKQPPVNHYYWLPEIRRWPATLEEFNGNFYGPYFAYLMRRHSLANTYITNLVKCGLALKHRNVKDTEPYEKVRTNCVKTFLDTELRIFNPEVVFCFGRRAEHGFRACVPVSPNRKFCYLIHPAAIASARRYGKTPEGLVAENDAQIESSIKEVSAKGAT